MFISRITSGTCAAQGAKRPFSKEQKWNAVEWERVKKCVNPRETNTGARVAQRVYLSGGSKGSIAQMVEQSLCKPKVQRSRLCTSILFSPRRLKSRREPCARSP